MEHQFTIMTKNDNIRSVLLLT